MGLFNKGKRFSTGNKKEKKETIKKIKSSKEDKLKKELPKNESHPQVNQDKHEKSRRKEIKNNTKTLVRKYTKQIKCAVTILLAIACAALTVTFYSKVDDDVILNQLNYSDKNKIGYQIDLKDTEFFDEDIQKSHMSYIASLLENIDLNLNYNLHFDKKVDYSYKYSVNAHLYITDGNTKDSADKVIFEDTEQLLSSETQTGNDTDVKINENLSIPYEKYNSIVQTFAEANGIAPSCYLDIKFAVDATGKYKDIEGISRSSETSLRIPLNQKVVDIDETSSTKEDSGQFVSTGTNAIWLILAIVFGILCAILIIISIKFIKTCIPCLAPYEKEIKDIFKKYDQLIVHSKRMFRINENLTEVDEFEDLVNVSDRIQQPIKFHEVKNGEESVFIVDNLQYETYVFHVTPDDKSS